MEMTIDPTQCMEPADIGRSTYWCVLRRGHAGAHEWRNPTGEDADDFARAIEILTEACWNCGDVHPDADAAMAAHERLREAAETTVADLYRQSHGMRGEDRARLISVARDTAEEQARIVGFLRSHGRLPPEHHEIE